MSERERRRRIVEYLRSGKTDEAASELAASREVYPGDGVLHHVIGMAFASSGTLAQAQEQLESATRLDPESAEILADLAQVQLARGDTDRAITSAEQAVALSPGSPLAHFTLGRACFVAECTRQARRPPPPLPRNHFALIDGRASDYLRALREMEMALDAGPPFLGAVRAGLALAYQRAGHYHAAWEQLRSRLAELAPGRELDDVQARLQNMSSEIVRERYWAVESGDLAQIEEAARAPQARPEAKLRLAHAYAALERSEPARAALAQAAASGYEARDAHITRAGRRQHYARVSDIHALIAGGLECIVDDELRFLPYAQIRTIRCGEPRLWREVTVELDHGEKMEALVPTLYRLSLRSPSDFIQSGRFTQLSYGPGETRYAYAIGARNLISDSGVIPFTEVESVEF
jgi:protein involved in temperature-dependent protein secretion